VRLPIRARLALVCAVLVAAIVVALGALVYLRLEADLRAAADDGLATRAATLLDEPIGAATIDIAPSDVGDILAQVLSPNGSIVAASPGLDGPVLTSADLASIDAAPVRELNVLIGGEELLSRIQGVRRADGTFLVVGVAFDEQRETLDRLRDLLVVVVPVAGLFAALVGWVVAGAALRPVDRMRREADAISGSEAGRRLQVPGTNDELSELGDSLNRMLDRLEAAVARERRFVDDASHELRTPLANLRTELELALRRSREPDELLAAVRSAADESERLSALAEDLLVLARLHDGRLPVRPEPTQVGALMAQVADSFAGRAAAQEVALDANVDGDGTALVDPTRIRQALGNLVDNALRHTPTGGWVRMQLRRSPGSLSLAVVDSGEGFPEALLADVFDPFRRGDPARSRDHGGAGLGLAIVRAVAEAHGGRVAASNNPSGGATVELVLPA